MTSRRNCCGVMARTGWGHERDCKFRKCMRSGHRYRMTYPMRPGHKARPSSPKNQKTCMRCGYERPRTEEQSEAWIRKILLGQGLVPDAPKNLEEAYKDTQPWGG